MLSAYYVADYCILSNALKKTFTVEANTTLKDFKNTKIQIHNIY